MYTLNYCFFIGSYCTETKKYSDSVVTPCQNNPSSFCISSNSYFSEGTLNASEYFHQCAYCGKSFRDKSYFQLHVRLHTGDRPFICNICSKGFCKQSHLKEHLRIHTGEKPFKCKFCDYCAIQSSHLKAHYATKHTK